MPHRRIYREQVELSNANKGVGEAARRMRERRVGALVVVDDRSHPIGIVTGRDLAIRVLGDDSAIAPYFNKEAAEAQAKADNHGKMEDAYKKLGPALVGKQHLDQHCNKLSAGYAQGRQGEQGACYGSP
jgi:CBS domain